MKIVKQIGENIDELIIYTYFIVPQYEWNISPWYFSNKLKRYHLTKKAWTFHTITRSFLEKDGMSLGIAYTQS